MSDLSREAVGWRNRAQTAEREVQRLSHTRIALSLRVQELEKGTLKIIDYIHDEVIDHCDTAEECRSEIVNYSLNFSGGK